MLLSTGLFRCVSSWSRPAVPAGNVTLGFPAVQGWQPMLGRPDGMSRALGEAAAVSDGPGSVIVSPEAVGL